MFIHKDKHFFLNIVTNNLSMELGMSKNNPVFKTQNLALAAFLFSSGHRLATTTLQENGQRCIFHFVRCPKIEGDLLDFYEGRAMA